MVISIHSTLVQFSYINMKLVRMKTRQTYKIIVNDNVVGKINYLLSNQIFTIEYIIIYKKYRQQRSGKIIKQVERYSRP